MLTVTWRSFLGVMAVALVSSAPAALAQNVRMAGTIVGIDGPVLTIKSDKGEVKVALADKATILALEKVKMDGIKAGEFAGVGAIPQADGSQRAVRINIFDEARRGTGEGHGPWSGSPNGTMTNATVESTVVSVEGQVLMLKYKGGEKKVIVPPEAVIQRYVPGTANDLKPGAAVTINAATPKPDGTFETTRVNVGRDGYVPQ